MTKPRRQGGGYVSENSRGDRFASGNASRSSIDRSNHLHFHKDGVTVTNKGRKTTILSSRRYCNSCGKETNQRSSDQGSTWYCSKCESNMGSYPK